MVTGKTELTRLTLDNLQPAKSGSNYEVADILVRGLRVRVADATVEAGRFKGKAAVITFVLLARFPPNLNPTRRAIGRYNRDDGPMTLQSAREVAREWKRKIALGIDPAAELREQQEAAETARQEVESQRAAQEQAARNRKSLKDLLDIYEDEVLADHKRGAATRRALDGEQGLLKDFTDREPASLTRAEIVQVLKQRAKVAPTSANRQLAYASAFFNWCVNDELLTVNPVLKVKKPSKENTRDRHHSLGELKEIWNAAGKLSYPFKQLYRLCMVLPMRREENAAIPLDELDFVSDAGHGEGIWTLPAARTKRANALRIPLSPLARSIIQEAIAHPDRPKDSKFVFTTTGEASVSGFSKAKKRLDAEIRAERIKRAAQLCCSPVEMPHWTLHDLRTSFNTVACDILEIDAHVADRILNHVATATTSKVMRIYNRSELFEPRRAALKAWAELLEREFEKEGSGSVGTPKVPEAV